MSSIVAIEGNIGVGKSTFIDILHKNFRDSSIVPEPVDKWLNIKGSDDKNILQTFYDDVDRWAYTFQNMAYITRIMTLEETIKEKKSKYIFLDRSIGTDKNVFERMLFEDGKINVLEHNIYKLWEDFYYKYVKPEFTYKIIYLRAEPEVCIQRIKQRGRPEEKNISIEYLNKLHKYHEEWLIDNKEVIVIDCNKDFENNIEYQKEIIEKIQKFI